MGHRGQNGPQCIIISTRLLVVEKEEEEEILRDNKVCGMAAHPLCSAHAYLTDTSYSSYTIQAHLKEQVKNKLLS